MTPLSPDTTPQPQPHVRVRRLSKTLLLHILHGKTITGFSDVSFDVPRGAFVRHPAPSQATGPPAHGGQPHDVQDRGKADDGDHERTHRGAVAEGERPARRAGSGQLETDEERGSAEDQGRPRQVDGERAAQRRASSVLRLAASAASRPVTRRNS